MTSAWLTTQFDLSSIEVWNPPVTQVRAVILDHLIVWSPMVESMEDLPPHALPYVVPQHEVEQVERLAYSAVVAGRLIDFGHWPNAVIKNGGQRGGPLWQRRAIQSPFSDPWVFVHTWDPTGGVWTAVYLVNPCREGFLEVCELQPVKVAGRGVLMIGDRVMFGRDAPQSGRSTYHAFPSPNIVRFGDDPRIVNTLNEGRSPESAAVGNVGDPTMSAMLILATRNVGRETIRAPEKLQRARAKRGQPPIPNYEVVDSAPYVTAIQARGAKRQRGEGLGGHHRSPIPHIRMGHPREIASGRSIFIADTLVNVPPELRQDFKGQRSHYRTL